MSVTCRVAQALPKIQKAVRRAQELDELMFNGRGGMSAKRLKRMQDKSWEELRRLEADAMLTRAASEEGRTLQLILSIPEAYTLRSWAQEETPAIAAHCRLNGVLIGLLEARDVSILQPDVLDWYVGPWPRWRPEPPRSTGKRSGIGPAAH